jgi:hypothetical protein
MSDFDPVLEGEKLKEIAEGIEQKKDQIEELITKIKGKFITFDYDGIKIRVKGAVPHSVKQKAFDLKQRRKELEDDGAESLDEVLQPTYDILADICLDSPWNSASAWKQVEEETGASDVILGRILEQIADTAKSIKKFR